jgi:hypothetical protein
MTQHTADRCPRTLETVLQFVLASLNIDVGDVNKYQRRLESTESE